MINIEFICQGLKLRLNAEEVKYVNPMKYPNAPHFQHIFEAKFRTGEILEIKLNEYHKRFYFRKGNDWVPQYDLALEM